MERAAWVNGTLTIETEPQLAVTDRGFHLGDGVFETLRVVGGRILELPLHAERLAASAAALEIPLPPDLERRLRLAIGGVCSANRLDGPGTVAAVRVTVSRGPVAGRNILPPTAVSPNLVVQAWPVDPLPAGLLDRGLHLAISSVRRDPLSPLATVKTTSRAEFVYARLEARRRGADDALFLTTDGNLAEATSASIFIADGAGLATPSMDCGILAGTTRHWVLSGGAAKVGALAREGRLFPGDLMAAEEAFLASSVAGILPVTRVDGAPIADGRPGPWTLRLREAREGEAASLAAAQDAEA